MEQIYDVFISYRRNGGFDTAGRINDLLIHEGYSVSYDIDTLREGRFDNQLLERIEQCVDFIVIVDKNCFERTVDPHFNPHEDWLRQELAYALQLKKNVIPVLLVGASFPKGLPKDIDDVRYCNGPKHNNEYFDSFYSKLKSLMHALPRKVVQRETNKSELSIPFLKLKADLDCLFYLDGEETAVLKAGVIQKFPLKKGEYELCFVSVDNSSDRLEIEFVMPEIDKLLKVCLDRQRIDDERSFNVDGVLFKMVRVEGGTFQIGSSDDDIDSYDKEKPQHRVTLSDYYMGETQVTQELWKAVMGSNPSKWKGDSLPVEQVSWDECQLFLKRLNQILSKQLHNGTRFTLPTEAQWEFAARGGNKSIGYKYAGSNTIKEVAWYEVNSGGKTHSVKQKKCNEIGLYDMSGNVWEWCHDRYGSYEMSNQQNPAGPSSGSTRVLRGSSWGYGALRCRVAYRSAYNPNECFCSIGFRLALVNHLSNLQK